MTAKDTSWWQQKILVDDSKRYLSITAKYTCRWKQKIMTAKDTYRWQQKIHVDDRKKDNCPRQQNILADDINKILADDGLGGDPDVVLAGEAEAGGLVEDLLGLLLGAVQEEDPALRPLYLQKRKVKTFNSIYSTIQYICMRLIFRKSWIKWIP